MHEHRHHRDLASAMRGRVPQGPQRAHGGGESTLRPAMRVVPLRDGEVDRDADLGEPGVPQLTRQRIGHAPAVGEEDRVMVAREGPHDVDDVGAQERLAPFDRDDHRARLGQLRGDTLEFRHRHLVPGMRRTLTEGTEAAGEIAAIRDLDDAVDRPRPEKASQQPCSAPAVAGGGGEARNDGQSSHDCFPQAKARARLVFTAREAAAATVLQRPAA